MDGLRAIAILLVIGMHVNNYFLKYGYSTTWMNSLPPFKGGWIGVPLFFVLSGYLIGGQIWNEYLKTKTINSKRFILRRGLRIWPLYYFIVLVFLLFPINTNLSSEGIWSNFLFLSNYWSDNGVVPGVMWSLATEEHFYILAPLLIYLTSAIFGYKSLKFYRRALVICLFIPSILRYISWEFILNMSELHMPTYMSYIYRPIHTNCEGLIAGMWLANCEREGIFKESQVMAKDWLILFISLIIFVVSFKSKIVFNFLGVSIGFTALVWFVIYKKSVIQRILFWKGFFPIAKTSFCLYLIHVPVLALYYEKINVFMPDFNWANMIVAFVIVTLLGFIFSVPLFYGIEKPFLKLRKSILNL